MVVRHGEALRLDRAAIALLGVPALDPAIGQAKCPGYADVVILALRDVQDVVLAVTPGGDEIKDLLEERRIRFLRSGIVGGKGGEEGRSQLLLEMIERSAPGIGHGNQLV